MVCSSPVTWSATGSSSPAAGADLYKRLRKTAAEETRLRKINFLKKILCFPSYSVKYVLVMVTEVHVKHGETFKLTRSAYEINADSVSGSFFYTWLFSGIQLDLPDVSKGQPIRSLLFSHRRTN